VAPVVTRLLFEDRALRRAHRPDQREDRLTAIFAAAGLVNRRSYRCWRTWWCRPWVRDVGATRVAEIVVAKSARPRRPTSRVEGPDPKTRRSPRTWRPLTLNGGVQIYGIEEDKSTRLADRSPRFPLAQLEGEAPADHRLAHRAAPQVEILTLTEGTPATARRGSDRHPALHGGAPHGPPTAPETGGDRHRVLEEQRSRAYTSAGELAAPVAEPDELMRSLIAPRPAAGDQQPMAMGVGRLRLACVRGRSVRTRHAVARRSCRRAFYLAGDDVRARLRSPGRTRSPSPNSGAGGLRHDGLDEWAKRRRLALTGKTDTAAAVLTYPSPCRSSDLGT